MLLGPEAEGDAPVRREVMGSAVAAVACGVFLAMIVQSVIGGGQYPATEPEKSPLPEFRGSTQAVGEALFRDYLYPFELISLLVLAGIVGSVVLGYEPKRPLAPGRGLKAKQTEIRESAA
jgi:NADH:ubiquinone oxidoreductase subunit 6 (subunit J)